MKAVVSGATGYIGGRLVPRLLEDGVAVRCMTRNPGRLDLAPWREAVEVVGADAVEASSLAQALAGCDVAYYLIHSMGAGGDFAESDRLAAENFRDAAASVNLKRIVYLGGLGTDDGALSPHLESRHEVGRILMGGATPVTWLRAAVIIGSGSMSFEMLRHLTEVLPVMMRPRWVRTKCQPIGIRNVLAILAAALSDDSADDHVYDIGGPDILTYEEMMQQYAEVAGLRKRVVVPLPIFSAKLSPTFVGMVTPLPSGMAKPLIDSLMHDVVVTNPTPPGFPPDGLLTYRESVELALGRISRSWIETRWSDAVTSPAVPMPHDPIWAGEKMYVDRRVFASAAPPDDLLWAVTRVGGDVGYYAINWAWSLRGIADQMIGGVGLRRGRRDPEDLRVGEALDFFRVVEMDPERRRLTLQAEMKVPGTAWLAWQVDETREGSRLTQEARFVPRGIFGRLYWYAMLPFHAPIFKRMARRMTEVAVRRREMQLRR